MRVALLHTRYQHRGGEEAVAESETKLLRIHGHRVELIDFYNDFLINLPDPRARLSAAVDTIWSRDAARTVRRAASSIQPEVVHVHNTFPVASPSVYSAARSNGAAVVQTLHNYRLLCPNALFFRDGHICEDCLGRFFAWPGVLHACYRNSRSQTGVTAAMLAFHRARRTWWREVDLFIALTEFSRRKFIEGGLPAPRVVVKPNFLADDPEPSIGGSGFLFVGRLDRAKGIELLIQAWRSLPEYQLTIAGDGPLLDQAARDAQWLSLVRVLGRQSHDLVLQLMRTHSALVIPSLWYEAFPMTIIEAFATGLPVIGSRLGSISEIVEDGRTGLLFQAGNASELAAKVRWAAEHPAEMRQMGINAHSEFEAKYTAEIGYKNLIACYEQAIEIRKSRAGR
jgi:glycosyltransferase involved in cell wall biosynthesis